MGVRLLPAAVLAACLLLLVGGSGAAAATDLSTLLARPPSTDWIARGGAPDVLVGTFTAHAYADYLKADGASPGATEFDLNLYGFTRGYSLVWEQQSTQDLLIERAFEFRQDSGARAWYNLLRIIDRTAPEYKHDIPLPPSVPNGSAGAFVWSDGQLETSVNFWKGNVVYMIDMSSYANDLSVLAISQASAEYVNAPAHTQAPPGAGQALNDWVRTAATIGGIVMVGVAIVTATTILLLTRRRHPVAALPAAATISPDGAYWWDGQSWRLRTPLQSPGALGDSGHRAGSGPDDRVR